MFLPAASWDPSCTRTPKPPPQLSRVGLRRRALAPATERNRGRTGWKRSAERSSLDLLDIRRSFAFESRPWRRILELISCRPPTQRRSNPFLRSLCAGVDPKRLLDTMHQARQACGVCCSKVWFRHHYFGASPSGIGLGYVIYRQAVWVHRLRCVQSGLGLGSSCHARLCCIMTYHAILYQSLPCSLQ